MANYPILAAAGITAFAFLAHTAGATRQVLRTSPLSRESYQDRGGFDEVHRSWMMSVCAFQMVAVDLLALTGLLLCIALTDLLGAEQTIALMVAGFYFCWGGIWLIQLILFKPCRKDFLILSQWLLWFICSGLVYWGAQTL